MISISAIRSRYYDASRRVGVPDGDVVFATQPDWDGRPYIERRGDAYAYVVSERGVERECRLTEAPMTEGRPGDEQCDRTVHHA
jgi:hypothetical protein